jgi:internalin A
MKRLLTAVGSVLAILVPHGTTRADDAVPIVEKRGDKVTRDDKEVVRMIQTHGGIAKREDDDPDKPVIGVSLCFADDVTDAHLKELKQLRRLTWLNLDVTGVTDAGLKDLKEFKRLTRLSLAYTKVTDVGLKDLKELRQITWLDLDGTSVTDAGLKDLKELDQLTTLYLHDTKVTDAGLKDLKELKKLTTLGLRGTKVTDAGVADLQKALPDCKIAR